MRGAATRTSILSVEKGWYRTYRRKPTLQVELSEKLANGRSPNVQELDQVNRGSKLASYPLNRS